MFKQVSLKLGFTTDSGQYLLLSITYIETSTLRVSGKCCEARIPLQVVIILQFEQMGTQKLYLMFSLIYCYRSLPNYDAFSF